MNFSDMDPLTLYNYQQYNLTEAQQTVTYPPYYNVKTEFYPNTPLQPLPLNPALQRPHPYPTYNPTPPENPKPLQNVEVTKEIDSKDNIKLLPGQKRRKPKGRTSNYWSKKVKDANFPFYGCTICNISFQNITDLDQHVTIHKGRLTSYDLRLRNKLKRKKHKKELKKSKKLKKIKQENPFDFEIKPEDGYIGNETAAEYSGNFNNDSQQQDIPTETQNSTITQNITNETAQNIMNEIQNKQNAPTETSQISVINTQNTEMTAQNITQNIKTITESTQNITNDSQTTTEIATQNTQNVTNVVPNTLKENATTAKNSANNDQQTSNGTNNESNDGNHTIKEMEDPRLQKLFKCFACQKQFSLSYYLKLHVRSHTDEKPYTCAVCGQSFITASHLGRHNKRIHLAVRFQCRVCYRFFSRFEYLTTHFDKKHQDQKLEGEPYDYNAILPYLKELEEELRMKTEQEKIKVEGVKKEQWFGDTTGDGEFNGGDVDEDDRTLLSLKQDKELEEKIPGIIVKELQVEFKREKKEEPPSPEEQYEEGYDNADQVEPGWMGGEGVLNGDDSDDDYFPPNTWAATPQVDIAPPSPPSKKKGAGQPLKCEFCDKKIKTASYMRVHLRTHTGERPFRCSDCGKGFITQAKMIQHVVAKHRKSGQNDGEQKIKVEDAEIKTEDGETKVKVKKKGKVKSKGKRVKVKGEKGIRKREHVCGYCMKRFLHLETLEVHLKSHEGEELVLKCNFCLETMPDEMLLKQHEATHTGPRPYICTICTKSYTKRETMIYHRRAHEETRYHCEFCSKAYYAKSKLQRHIVSHRVEKFSLRFECPVCAHLFSTKWHIQMHLQTHQKEGLIVEENRNEILAMVLQNARRIPRITKASHSSQLPLDSSQLMSQPSQMTSQSSQMTSQSSLMTSQSSQEMITAPDERSRVCNICGEVFQHFYYLEEHLKTHASTISIEEEEKSEEKKHICPVCNKGFKLHYYLKLHSFTHTKEKPFMCQQCGKGFITRGKLKRHLETHTGMKKHQCHICYKFFTRTSYLRIHIRTIHGTQDYFKQHYLPK